MDDADKDLIYPALKSNLYCLELDCMQLLIMGLDAKYVKELELELNKENVSWWVDCSQVEGSGEMLKIYTPISYNDEHVEISRSQLRKVIADWANFLKTKKGMERSY